MKRCTCIATDGPLRGQRGCRSSPRCRPPTISHAAHHRCTEATTKRAMQKRSEHRHDDEVIDRETIRAPMRRRNELYRDDPCGDKMSVQSASLVLWSNPGFLESRRQNVKPDVETGASGSCFFQRLRIAAIPTAPKVLIGGIWATVPTSVQMWSP